MPRRRTVDIGADGWISHRDAHQYAVREDSVRVTDDLVSPDLVEGRAPASDLDDEDSESDK